MKLTICGSIAFYSEMLSAKKQLEESGHEVKIPPSHRTNSEGKAITSQEYYIKRHEAKREETWVWDVKKQAMLDHFEKIAWSDAIVVLNYDKNNIKGYVGANTLMEMGLALYLNKPIYLLNDIPEMPYTEEILGMKPIVLYRNLNIANSILSS